MIHRFNTHTHTHINTNHQQCHTHKHKPSNPRRSETHAIKPTKPPIRNPRRRFETHRSKPIQKKSSSEPPSELSMINPTDPPINQQIHCFKPTINRSQPTDPNPARRSTTNDPLQPQHTSVTTQPWTKHRTQPQPITPLSTGHSLKKKKNYNHHSDPRQKPQPPLTHAVTHDPNTEPTIQPRTTINDPNTGPNREGRERRDGV